MPAVGPKCWKFYQLQISWVSTSLNPTSNSFNAILVLFTSQKKENFVELSQHVKPDGVASREGSNRFRYGAEVNNLIRFKAFLNALQLIPTLCTATGALQLTTAPGSECFQLLFGPTSQQGWAWPAGSLFQTRVWLFPGMWSSGFQSVGLIGSSAGLTVALCLSPEWIFNLVQTSLHLCRTTPWPSSAAQSIYTGSRNCSSCLSPCFFRTFDEQI